MDPLRRTRLLAAYERVADEYVERIAGELEHKPIDRALLTRLAREVPAGETICDLGCGPGHVARFLAEQGATVIGVDLSPAMVARAREQNPGLTFVAGDMLALPIADRAWGGIAAFYSILHVDRCDVTRALLELRRVLRPGGLLLVAFHIGDSVKHLDDWWGHAVSVDFVFFEPDEMRGYLERAGFEVVEVITRAPYPDVEYPSERAYLFARKP